MVSPWLRPGGIVGGPALMSLADYAVWVALLGEIGPEPMTVTVNLTINFFKPIPGGDVIAETRLHKVGKRLASGDVLMFADGDDEPAAQASVTYSIPQH
jgi:acyl-coenzyme A thioesterase PaaI-like protein